MSASHFILKFCIDKGIENMGPNALCFQEIDRTMSMAVGGKGANLGELSRIEGIRVPEGFCVTTEAYKKITENNHELRCLLTDLTRFKAENRGSISETSAKIRMTIEKIAIPMEVAEEIAAHLAKFGEQDAFAVRSSATAEDLPTASFAGQQDTYLNIIGKDEILKHVSKCWASLFTERAVIYRLHSGFDHRKIHLSVVIQKMVFPQVAGILFTADPVAFNRKVLSIDASFGLGEAMVSGLVNPDLYKVCGGKVIDKKISSKKLAILALKDGGTKEQEIEPERQNRQALTDAQIVQLEHVGRKIEAHFGSPQDIEWCLVDDEFHIVQSRPITTLYPIPEANDQENHVYVSVGHQQMMTKPMKPLGLSFYLLATPAPMSTAGGRLFVDVTHPLASPVSRTKIIDALGKSDPLIKDALMTIVERGDFIKSPSDESKESGRNKNNPPAWSLDARTDVEHDPKIVAELIENNQASIRELTQNIQTKSGSAVFDFILEDMQQLKGILFDPRGLAVIMVAMEASSWINEKMHAWLGEQNAADTLSQSVENNVTSEMGLALMDVADAIRPYPQVIDYLQRVKNDHFLDDLLGIDHIACDAGAG
jgi:rifampicin phosphotransferase